MSDDIKVIKIPAIDTDPWYVKLAKNLLPIIVAIFLALLIRAYIMEPIKVSGASMDETYHDGQYVLLEKVSYRFRNPQRGDVVVCHYPDEYYTQSGRNADSWCVKRVIGIPGDKLQTIDGVVYLNGERLDETYLSENAYTFGIESEITIPDGCVFVMGDNRMVSADSREPDVGPIPFSQIKGRLIW